MSEPTPPPRLEGAADGAAPGLSAGDVDRLLADFRSWLLDHPAAPADESEPAELDLDLSALVGSLIALRQEVNLQTRASRAQTEQTAQAVEVLGRALEALERPPQPSADDALRPLLRALVDVHDALSLARREVLRLRDGLPAEAPAPAPPPAVHVRLPFWARWLGLERQVQRDLAPLQEWQRGRPEPPPDVAPKLRQMADAMFAGYDMSLQRLERALVQHGLERIACVGEPFDPETMEVAEVVRDPARGGTEVIEELRPGYRWRGRLFRYAQVRVARP
jgi:molecular chaperone GrpE